MTDQPEHYLSRHAFQDLLNWWTRTREVLAADSAPDVKGTVPQPTAEQLRSWERGEDVEEEDDDTLTRILDCLLLCHLAEFEHSLRVDGDALFAEELRAIVYEVADEIIDRGFASTSCDPVERASYLADKRQPLSARFGAPGAETIVQAADAVATIVSHSFHDPDADSYATVQARVNRLVNVIPRIVAILDEALA